MKLYIIKGGQLMKNLFKALSISMIAMILVMNSTTVFASDDNSPQFPDVIIPPIVEYCVY